MTHSTSVQLTTVATEHPYVLERAFNTFDPESVDRLYEADALFVPRPGHPTAGPGRLPAHRDFLALRVPIRVTPRHTYVSGDLALLIVDWVVEGRAAHGGQVRIAGTATDVARRGPDGFWRYVIDNPFGTADEPDPADTPPEQPRQGSGRRGRAAAGAGQSAMGR
ncbi:YybH family protein [Streptomyces sp. NPDC091289]|uniref:YybH family protein n=1 Tax=Streptomyces sp. NPDC091289 TaxID=3365989 RepID=UPI0038162E7D